MENQYPQHTKPWYDNRFVVIALCIFFFPIGLYALWKNNEISKQWKIGGTAIIAILFIAAGLSDNNQQTNNREVVSNLNNSITDSTQTDTISTTDTLSNKKASLEERLKRELNALSKPFDGSTYKESIKSLQLEIALFDVWSKMIKEATKSTNSNEVKLGTQLAYRVKLLQTQEFPKMRKAYQKIASKKLWEEDIEVTINGYAFTTLEFTGGAFASNKNKQAFQMQINDIMKMLRFKRVSYKFTKYDQEYDYYNIESPKDNEIKRLTEL